MAHSNGLVDAVGGGGLEESRYGGRLNNLQVLELAGAFSGRREGKFKLGRVCRAGPLTLRR